MQLSTPTQKTQIQIWSRVSITGLQGCNWVILRGGRRYIYDRKDEIIHGLSPSVKCIAPLFRDMFLAKVWNAGGPPPCCAPGIVHDYFWRHKGGLKKQCIWRYLIALYINLPRRAAANAGSYSFRRLLRTWNTKGRRLNSVLENIIKVFSTSSIISLTVTFPLWDELSRYYYLH